MKTFSEYAQAKLLDLFENHEHEVGIKLKAAEPVKYKDYKATDCITYAINVISGAFVQTGNPDAAARVRRMGNKGTELAKYLVDTHGWKGIYINPDVNHPVDIDPEHTYTNVLASRTCKYYGVPLTFRVTNYRPTPSSHSSFQKLNRTTSTTDLNSIDVNSLNSVKFGFGVSRGGMHTWVFSKGNIYEVHWDQIGSDLYEDTPLTNFPWLSGLIVVPPDQASLLTASAKLRCAN